MHRSIQCLLLTGLTSICFAGCDTSPGMDYSEVELVGVTGKVTLDGSPVPYAVVTFESVDTGSFSGGVADENGNYQLRFDVNKMGVPPGRKLVQIGTARKILGISSDSEAGDPASEESGDGEPGDDLREQASRIEAVPECYHKDSKLFVTVDDSSSVFNFELKSDCSTVGSN